MELPPTSWLRDRSTASPHQVLVASSTSLGSVSEFFYGDSLASVRAAHAAETAAAHAAQHVDHDDHGDPAADVDDHGSVAQVLETEELDPVDPGGAHHRRLGGGASPLLRNIAFCLTTCGLVAFFVGLCKQRAGTVPGIFALQENNQSHNHRLAVSLPCDWLTLSRFYPLRRSDTFIMYGNVCQLAIE